MPVKTKEHLLNLRIHPPAILKTGGYAINWLAILVYGPAGSGKSTLAHAWLHQAERSEIAIKVDNKDLTVRFLPIGLLLESFARMHSYAECVGRGVCPLVTVIKTSEGGDIAETTLSMVKNRLESAKAGAKEIVIPFVVVDSAAYLVEGQEKFAARWRGENKFLDGLGSLSPYGVLVILDQIRETIQATGMFQRSRPTTPKSLFHRFHLKVLTHRTGAEATTFRLKIEVVNLADQRPPASDIEITRDSLVALISRPGEGGKGADQRKGTKWVKATEPVVRVEFDSWVDLYVPR